jgi:hypothetical protein
MEGGSACFRNEVPFIMNIAGTINGEHFTVEGKGSGKSNIGYSKGKWICTSGRLPISWAALSSTLSYSFKCFANYPNGLTHFCQETVPEGYTQERVTRFHDDGTLKSYYEVHYNKGLLMSKVTVHGDGFRKDSPVLLNTIKCMKPSVESNYPFENGVRSLVHLVFPLKGGGEDFIVATQTTVNRPLVKWNSVKPQVFHFTRNELMHTMEVDEEHQHIIQQELLEAFEMKLFSECDG